MKVGLLVDITEDYKGKIRHAKSLGFDFGQLAMWDMSAYTDEFADELKRTLKEENFTPISLWCGWSGPVIWKYPEMYHSLGLVPDWLRAKRLDDLKRGAWFARKLGVQNIASHTGFVPDDPRDPRHIAIVHALTDLCTELKTYGQTFGFETGEELPLTLNMMIHEIGLDNVGVNFDPANLINHGRGNPNDAMDLLGSRIFGMHAKDAVPANFGEFKGREVAIGTGKVDFQRLIRQLKQYGYDGDIVIERETKPGPERDNDIIQSRKFLENIISEVY